MQEERYITIISERKKITLSVRSILYILMDGKWARIHVYGGRVYQTRRKMEDLEQLLGDDFLKVHRGCLVSVMAIHDITDTVNLNSGEVLDYARRKKTAILSQLREKQQRLIDSFPEEGTPSTPEEYRAYYASFDNMPFAFTDIEMVFDEEHRAVDWIFRYGNEALAALEMIPLERMIGASFHSLFANMDSKWLRCYERATLFGETIQITGYSPEIDKTIQVTCFPTFKGHCGCILFDTSQIRMANPGTGEGRRDQIPENNG
ncbi:MAG: LytTR family transcriptional regulator DNA-binding domain-containing protein [Faecousia sp.]